MPIPIMQEKLEGFQPQGEDLTVSKMTKDIHKEIPAEDLASVTLQTQILNPKS